MAISARVEAQRLVIDFDPQPGQGMPELFNSVAKISGDYAATLAGVPEVLVVFSRADDERKIFTWMQGAIANKKIVTVQPVTLEAYNTLRGEESFGRKAWTNLLQPGGSPAKKATRPLMRPTSKIKKPEAP